MTPPREDGGAACERCEFASDKNKRTLECHRYAPKMADPAKNDGSIAGYYNGEPWWPHVNPDDFCGEFKARRSTAAQALLARSQTVARIVADAHIGSPEALRATAARYAAAAEELHATGHEDVASLLDIFGQTALRNARLIEAGFCTQRRPHWLKLVTA